MNLIASYLLAGLTVLLPALADWALKGVVLLSLAGLAALLMRGASAATRHLTWLLAIVGLLVLPLLSDVLPSWRVLPAWTTLTSVGTAPGTFEPPAVKAVEAPTAAPLTRPFTERAISRTPTPPVTPNPADASQLSRFFSGIMSGHRALWLGLIGIWTVGAALLTFRLIACLMWLRVSTRGAESVSEGPLTEALANACGDLGVDRPVKLFLSNRGIVPLVWGIFRPHLVLPAEARTWDMSRLRAVLLHELAHVKRHDLLVLSLTHATCVFHWFNPLVWLAAWRLHVERERACDDLVLSAGVKAPDYAEHLLHVATRLDASSPVAALGMARPSRLEDRLLAVLNERSNRRGVTRTLALATVAIGLCVIVPMAMLRAADDPNSDHGISHSEMFSEMAAKCDWGKCEH